MENDRLSKAQVGYSVAIQLLRYEGRLLASRFSAMLTANSILIAAASLLDSMRSTSSSISAEFKQILLFLGLLLCLVWFLFARRGFSRNTYWILSARELEEKFLKPVETLSRGGKHAAGNNVTIQIEGSPDINLHQHHLISFFTAEKLWYLLIAVFAVLHSAIFILL